MDEQKFIITIQKLATADLTDDQLKRLAHLANNYSLYK